MRKNCLLRAKPLHAHPGGASKMDPLSVMKIGLFTYTVTDFLLRDTYYLGCDDHSRFLGIKRS